MSQSETLDQREGPGLAGLASLGKEVRQRRTVWSRLRRDRVALGGLAVFVILLAVALAAPVIAPYDPNEQDLYSNLQGPSGTHLLGTDDLGRDLLSRVLAGARPTLLIGAVVLAARLLLGVLLGLVAGWFGGRVDEQVMLVASWVSAFPSLLLAIVLLESLGGQKSNSVAITTY